MNPLSPDRLRFYFSCACFGMALGLIASDMRDDKERAAQEEALQFCLQLLLEQQFQYSPSGAIDL